MTPMSWTVFVYFIVSCVLWRLLRQLVVKHPLHNIAGPPSPSFVKGHIGQIFDPQGWEFQKMLVEKYGGVVKISGIFGKKQLVVVDAKALNHILIKDQHIYQEPRWLIEGNGMIFGDGLFGSYGARHQIQRKILNQALSTDHLRDMLPIFYQVSYKLRDYIASRAKSGPQEIDIIHWITRAALELIGQSGLGYSFDNLDDSPSDDYSVTLRNLTPAMFSLALPRRFLTSAAKFGPSGFRRFLLKILPSKRVQRLREMVDIMDRTTVKIFQEKMFALQQGEDAIFRQIGRGKDIMNILLKANMKAVEEDRLPESELIGQMSCLMFAATDTTSGVMARILHILAENPDVQDRLRKEIVNARQASGGDLDYNRLQDLPYLDAVIRETLRLYPPLPATFIPRSPIKDVILPLSKPIIGSDGTEVREIFVPSGTNISVSIIGTNRNPDIWGKDAYEWKPERWLSPLPDSVTQAHVPGAYSSLMTFMGGRRACIGFQFALLEIKVVVSTLVESFNFLLTEKDIFWNYGGVVWPTVKGDPAGNVRLPLKVTLVKNT